MAPKKTPTKPKATKAAKAKPAALPKAKAASPKAVSPCQALVPSASAAAGPAAKRRQLARRDSDTQVERALFGRLRHVPTHIWESKTNASGESVRDYIKRAIKANAREHKRLGSCFWAGLEQEFELTESVADSLPDPPGEEGGEEVDMQMLDMLQVAHSDNPATRNSQPFERYLDHCPKINKTTAFGMLQLIIESPTCVRSIALKCQMAACKYFVMRGGKDDFPDYWEVMKVQFDYALMCTWEEAYESGVSLAIFARANAGILRAFLDVDDMNKAMAQIDDVAEVADEVKRLVGSSAVGKSMFSEKWLEVSRALYRKDIVAKLADVEHEDYVQGAVDGFQAAMVTSASQLEKLGYDAFERTKVQVSFFSEEVTVPAYSLNDEWEVTLSAKMKTAAVNSKLIPAMPWEELLLEFPLMNVPTVTRMGDAAVASISPAREAALQYIIEAGCTTLYQMIQVISKKAGALRALDRSFECELSFLCEIAEKLLQQRVRDVVLGCLPSEAHHPSMAQSLVELNKLPAGKYLQAAGAAVRGEVDGVIGLASNLAEGLPPKPQAVAKFTDFFKLVLKRCELFLAAETTGDGGVAALLGATRTVYGKEAMNVLYNTVQREMANPKGQDVKLVDLRPFKTFGWLLSDAQRENFQKWLGMVCSAADNKGNDGGAGGAILCQALAKTGQAGSSASGSGKAGPKAQKEAAKKSTLKAEAKKDDMLKLFQPRKKAKGA